MVVRVVVCPQCGKEHMGAGKAPTLCLLCWAKEEGLVNTDPEPAVDPELVAAIDAYLASMRKRMIARVVKGEAEHAGLWKGYSPDRLQEEAMEEVDDFHVYMAMRAWHLSK